MWARPGLSGTLGSRRESAMRRAEKGPDQVGGPTVGDDFCGSRRGSGYAPRRREEMPLPARGCYGVFDSGLGVVKDPSAPIPWSVTLPSVVDHVVWPEREGRGICIG
jgi:hypothetical protein